MEVTLKVNVNGTQQDTIEFVFIVDPEKVNSSTQKPSSYTEEYQQKFHKFCNDIYNFMQSLERKKVIKLIHEMRASDGYVSELGYRKGVRRSVPESYYLPYWIFVNGVLVKSRTRVVQFRISTHEEISRGSEVLVTYLIKDWKNPGSYEKHKKWAKDEILLEIKNFINDYLAER